MNTGQLVVCENCDFSESGDDKPYDVFCASEDWWKDYISEDNLH